MLIIFRITWFFCVSTNRMPHKNTSFNATATTKRIWTSGTRIYHSVWTQSAFADGKNMKGYFSLCAGLMFTHTSDETYYAIGVAGYRFTKTQRTVLDDASQYDAPRYSIHADYATALSDRLNFNASIFHMIKAGTSTTIAGGIFGFINNSTVYADGPLSIFNLGAFYRLGNAVIPYVGFEYHNLSIGLTYDVDVSTATAGSAVAKSFELSLVWRKFAEGAKPAAGKYHSPF